MNRQDPHLHLPPAGKLFAQETPQEMHRRLVWGGKECSFCGGRPVSVSCRIYWPADELKKKDSLGYSLGQYGKPVAQFDHSKMGGGRDGKYHFVSELFGCTRCEKVLDQAAADTKLTPSFCYVQWDRGVAADRLVVGVTANGLV